MDDCIFCKSEVIENGLLYETDNFYLRAVMKGAIAPGHILLISKEHLSCFGEMPQQLDEEYSEIIAKTKEKFNNIFCEPILVEQGIHGQSVYHAHLHFFPTNSEWYDFSEKQFTSFIPEEVKVTRGSSIATIRNVFESDGQYVSIEEQDELYICHTKGYGGSLRPVRAFPVELTGLTELLHWQTMSDSEKEKNRRWIEETINKIK